MSFCLIIYEYMRLSPLKKKQFEGSYTLAFWGGHLNPFPLGCVCFFLLEYTSLFLSKKNKKSKSTNGK